MLVLFLPTPSAGEARSYKSLPTSTRSLLYKQLDWDSKGVEKDLIVIADQMLNWEEKLIVSLKLSHIETRDIKEEHKRPVLVR